MSKLHPFNEDDAALFKDVIFYVEANSYERHTLWERFFSNPDPHCKVTSWEQITRGQLITIGVCDSNPVCVDISWAVIEGYMVMFYYGCSRVVDHDIIEKWFEHFVPHYHARHCDAMNFTHCYGEICRLKDKNE